jgi:aspartyl/asparaginyl beta-hydroxylase (cupin superfamily)
MSQQNVEVRNEAVRRFIWAFENDTDAFRDILHPEIEWFPIDENRTRVAGVEDAMRNRNQWLDAWDEHRFDLEEVVEQDDNVVVLSA